MITLALLDYPPEDLVPLGRYSMFRVGHNNMRSFIGDRVSLSVVFRLQDLQSQQLLVSSEVHWLLVQQASEFRTVIRLIENPISSGLYAREMLESFCGELLAHVERHHPTGVSNAIDLALRRQVSEQETPGIANLLTCQLLIRLLYSYAMGGKNFNNGPYLFGLDDTEMRHALRRPSPKDSGTCGSLQSNSILT